MSTTVLLPVKNHAQWARRVAEVVADVEDEDTEAVVLHVFDSTVQRVVLNASVPVTIVPAT